MKPVRSFAPALILVQVAPLLVLFQMPPPAPAMKKVLEGLGMPTTAEARPWKFAGPTVRHLNPATVAESSVCADAIRALTSSAVPAVSESKRRLSIDISAGG